MVDTIPKLVNLLPEKYQPIFNHPSLSNEAARPCEDRLNIIKEIYFALESDLKRPLRVLDLGCAQGYFSFHLGAIGAHVTGIDYLAENINLCRALQCQNPDLNVQFFTDRIENVIRDLDFAQYDLVLCLSVFHHIVYENSVCVARDLITDLAKKNQFLICELATKAEPLYWASKQPADLNDLFDKNLAFVHEISQVRTHLSDISRPIFSVSNSYCVLDGLARKISKWYAEPHSLAKGIHRQGRRYYESSTTFLKYYRLGESQWLYNVADFERECNFFKECPQEFLGPKKIRSGSNSVSAWIEMDLVNGESLLNIINERKPIDPLKIVSDILDQACILEEAGLYHNDIRAWNCIIRVDGKAVLIDYGSVTKDPYDCAWPFNVFLSFLIFISEVASGESISSPFPLRKIAFSSTSLMPPLGDFINSLWRISSKRWSFKLMRDLLMKNIKPLKGGDNSIGMDMQWAIAIEKSLETLSANQKNLDEEFRLSESRKIQLESLQEQLTQLRQQHTDLLGVNHGHWELSESRKIQLESMYSSNSWKITYPLRQFSIIVQEVIAIPGVAINFAIGVLNKWAVAFINLSIKRIKRSPKLEIRIRSYIRNNPRLQNLIKNAINSGELSFQGLNKITYKHASKNISANLSPKAKIIFFMLVSKIKNND